MGQFSVSVTLAHPSDPARQAEVKLIVDTGTTSVARNTQLNSGLGPNEVPSSLTGDSTNFDRA
jgi:hypothetical protein